MSSRYALSNYLGDIFPKTATMDIRVGLNTVSVNWKNYFVYLRKFFIDLGAIDLLFDVGTVNENSKRNTSRQTCADMAHILKVLVGKTFGFNKPYERIHIATFGKSSYECCIFCQSTISNATLYRRLDHLCKEAHVIAKFQLAKENQAFYALRLAKIADILKPKLNSILEKYDLPDIDSMSSSADYQFEYEKGLPVRVIYFANFYLRCFVKCEPHFKKLSQFIDRFDGRVRVRDTDSVEVPFSNLHEARLYADTVAGKIFAQSQA